MSLGQAVSQLVSRYYDFNKLLDEAGAVNEEELGEDGISKANFRLSVEASLRHIRNDPSMRHGDEASLAASYCANTLTQLLLQNNAPCSLRLDGAVQSRATMLVEVIRALQAQVNFNTTVFVRMLNDFKHKLPVELIWLLHHNGIITLDTYITSNLGRPSHIGRLAQDIVALCKPLPDWPDRSAILAGLMNYFVMEGYGDTCEAENMASRGLRKVAVALLDSVTKKVLSRSGEERSSLYRGLSDLKEDNMLALSKYSTRQLTLILSYTPTLKVSDALLQQHKWTYTNTDEPTRTMFSQLLRNVEVQAAVEALRRILEQHEVNWELTLTCVSVMVKTQEEAAVHLNALIRERLCTSDLQMEGLITASLLIRQICLESPQATFSYQRWFSESFGDSVSSVANTRQNFAILIQFLSSIVPYESAQYLKVHISKPPFVPARCRPLLSDYITLAKTRLLDLHQPYEEQGIYAANDSTTKSTGNGSHGNADIQVNEAATLDVERAVEAYSSTGRVPPSVMEASIFKKPYFVGRFLPALLRPRVLPQPPDVTMNLIAQLQKMNKVPTSLYNTYEEECSKMASQLLDGVFSDQEEDDMSELLLNPWQQFEKAITTVVTAIESKSPIADLDNQCSLLAAKITHLVAPVDDVMMNDVTCDESSVVHLEMNHVKVTPLMSKITSAVISSIERLLESIPEKGFEFLPSLLRVFSSDQFATALHACVWRHCQQKQATTANVTGTICAHLHNARPVSVTCSHEPLRARRFMEALLHVLHGSGSQVDLLYTIRVCYSYLAHSKPSAGTPTRDDLVIQHYFTWLVARYDYALQHNSALLSHQTATIVRQILTWKANCSIPFPPQVPFTSWLHWELSINAHSDFLTHQIRKQYHRSYLFSLMRQSEHESFSETTSSQENSLETGPNQDTIATVCTELFYAVASSRFRCSHEVLLRCRTCGYLHDVIPCASSIAEILSLLQVLVNYLPSTDQNTPWLSRVMNVKVELKDDWFLNDSNDQALDTKTICSLNDKNTDPERCSKLKSPELANLCLVDVAMDLPPYLFFVDSMQACQGIDITKPVESIKTLIRLTEFSGPVLEFSHTLYFFQGFSLTQHIQCNVSRILTQCPVLAASFQYHWDALRQAITQIKQEKTPAWIAGCCRIHQNCQSLITGEVEPKTSHLYAASFLHRFHTCPRNEQSDFDKGLLAWLLNHDDAICAFVLFLSKDLTQKQFAGEMEDVRRRRLLHTLFTQRPAAFISDDENCSHFSALNTASDGFTQFMTLWCLKEHDSTASRKINETADSMSAMLHLLNRICSFYSEKADANHTEKVIRAPELVELTCFIKSGIRAASIRVCAGVDKKLIERCDPDIRMVLAKKLS